MNHETAVTFTHGHFNQVVFAVKFLTGEVEYTDDLVNIWGSGYCQSAQ